MPRYFNKTRSPLPLELPVSGSMVVPPKSFIEIDASEEGSASVARSVQKGYLVAPSSRAGAKPGRPAPKPHGPPTQPPSHSPMSPSENSTPNPMRGSSGIGQSSLSGGGSVTRAPMYVPTADPTPPGTPGKSSVEGVAGVKLPGKGPRRAGMPAAEGSAAPVRVPSEPAAPEQTEQEEDDDDSAPEADADESNDSTKGTRR